MKNRSLDNDTAPRVTDAGGGGTGVLTGGTGAVGDSTEGGITLVGLMETLNRAAKTRGWPSDFLHAVSDFVTKMSSVGITRPGHIECGLNWVELSL